MNYFECILSCFLEESDKCIHVESNVFGSKTETIKCVTAVFDSFMLTLSQLLSFCLTPFIPLVKAVKDQ